MQLRSECAPESGDDVSMEDAEQLVADLNSQRSTGGMLQPPRGDGHLADFPWLSEEQAAEPMDIEPGDGGAPQGGWPAAGGAVSALERLAPSPPTPAPAARVLQRGLACLWWWTQTCSCPTSTA